MDATAARSLGSGRPRNTKEERRAAATRSAVSATWATGVDYVVDELVINSGTSASTTAHTSGASFDAGNFTAIAT